MAASLASAPELQKNALPPRPESATSFSASLVAGSLANRLEQCVSDAACAWMASTPFLWQWPTAYTPIPDVKS